MKRWLLSLTLVFFSVMIYCQQTNDKDRIIYEKILSADSLIKGIYLNFSEFQQNSPSVIADFRSNEKNLPDNNIYNNMAVSRLRIIESNNDPVPFIQDHWGVCDGKNVFINFKGRYYQISIDGKYSSFKGSINARYGLSSYGVDYLLNVVSGRITKISSASGYRNKVRLKSVKRILSKENLSLYKEFMEDKNKKMMVYTYINLLNKSFEYR